MPVNVRWVKYADVEDLYPEGGVFKGLGVGFDGES